MNIGKLYPKLTKKEKRWIILWLGAYKDPYPAGRWEAHENLTTANLMFVPRKDLIAFLTRVVFGECANLEMRAQIWQKLTETYEDYKGEKLS